MLLRSILAALAIVALAGVHAAAQELEVVTPTYDDPGQAPASAPSAFAFDEIVATGHHVFGEFTQGFAAIVERAMSSYGLPNGYIIGEEASGAIIGGARYGEGVLYTRNAGQHRVYWQGPSLGLDVGASGSRVMMMIYNLPSVEAIYNRYVGVNGSAYVVAGLGMTALSRDGIYVVPVVSGVGARLGVNFGYLKFTSQPTWNPF
ncbi:MAG TPA: DUF1134 domain-containing protein [Bauldia sp.]|nr:DUF1134 domain-containing protein [Bauldia sp.]